MFQLSETDLDTQCHARAKLRGQETFTLVEQDLSAPTVLIEWIKQNIEHPETSDAKLRQAFEAALRWRKRAERKHPD